MLFMLFSACRTAICKSRRGGFKDTLPEDLLAPLLKVFYFILFFLFFPPPLSFCAQQLMTITLVNQVSNPGGLSVVFYVWFILCFSFDIVLKALIDKTKVDPSEVGDIVVGTVLAPGSQRAIECRMAAFFAGFPGTLIYCTLSLSGPFNFIFHHVTNTNTILRTEQTRFLLEP